VRLSTLGLAAIAALAVALPTTPSWAHAGPYWNCEVSCGAALCPQASFPHWTTRAEAIQNSMRACRRAGGGNHCRILQCYHESGNPYDPNCRHCVLPHKAPWRPPAYR
jgi:hypothetical protein